MGQNSFSCALEKQYYSRRWPQTALAYEHLEPYLRCWLDPDAVFAGKRVLDIGAGESTYSRLIADKFGAKEVVACELFPERMLPAVHANENPKLRFVAGDCFRLPIQTGSVDVVFASLLLHQLPNLSDALGEISRVLRNDGLFVGWEPNPFNLLILYRYFFKAHSPNQYLFWPRRILPAFVQTGFEVKTCYFYAKLPRVRNRFLGSCLGLIASCAKGR